MVQVGKYRGNQSENPYSRLPISKAAAAACQSLPMAISGSRFCAVFCQWQKHCGKLGQKSAQS